MQIETTSYTNGVTGNVIENLITNIGIGPTSRKIVLAIVKEEMNCHAWANIIQNLIVEEFARL
jgi:hypothetical protein